MDRAGRQSNANSEVFLYIEIYWQPTYQGRTQEVTRGAVRPICRKKSQKCH
jgi:hypothetical protein